MSSSQLPNYSSQQSQTNRNDMRARLRAMKQFDMLRGSSISTDEEKSELSGFNAGRS
jgi:hypothetical protein